MEVWEFFLVAFRAFYINDIDDGGLYNLRYT